MSSPTAATPPLDDDAEPDLDLSAHRGFDASARRVRAFTLLLLVALLAAPLFFELTPLDGLILCPIRAGFGIDCAGCGMTRSWIALTDGELRASLGAHPLGLLLYAAIALKALHLAVELRLDRAWTPPLWSRIRLPVLVCFALAFLILGLLRLASSVLT